jgi:hypothetical protein
LKTAGFPPDRLVSWLPSIMTSQGISNDFVGGKQVRSEVGLKEAFLRDDS